MATRLFVHPLGALEPYLARWAHLEILPTVADCRVTCCDMRRWHGVRNQRHDTSGHGTRSHAGVLTLTPWDALMSTRKDMAAPHGGTAWAHTYLLGESFANAKKNREFGAARSGRRLCRALS